jgi:hypothetical protein
MNRALSSLHDVENNVKASISRKNYQLTVSGTGVYKLSKWSREGMSCLGLGTEFRSEKIPRNRLGTVSVIPRKKVLIPRHSEFRGRANSEAQNGSEWDKIPRKNEILRKLHSLSDPSDGLYILL